MLVVSGRGEHHDGGPVRQVTERGEHAVPVQHRHIQVEQEYVGAGGPDDTQGLLAVASLANDGDIRFQAEEIAQAVADDTVVVGYHPDRHGTGMRTVTAAPCPGLLTICTVPPSSATRSRMCPSPEPVCGTDGSNPLPVSHTASWM